MCSHPSLGEKERQSFLTKISNEKADTPVGIGNNAARQSK